MSDFVIENLFPTSIYRTNLVDMGVQEEIDGVINQVQFVETPQHWGKTHKVNKPKNGNDYLFNQNFLSDFNLKLFERHIDYHVKNYMNVNDIRYVGNINKTSWMTLFEKDDYGHIHNHGGADISGAYYYSVNGCDGNFFFINPNLAHSTSCFKTNKQRFSIVPSIGDLILFPGYLQHGIERNNTNSRRMSISFNIYLGESKSW